MGTAILVEPRILVEIDREIAVSEGLEIICGVSYWKWCAQDSNR